MKRYFSVYLNYGILALAICMLVCSCGHLSTVPDRSLTGEVMPPTGYFHFGNSQPQLRTWKNFHYYEDASVIMDRSYTGRWCGDYAGHGCGLALRIDEGSRIVNTTAHPQYYMIWVMLPSHAVPGTVVPLRSADSTRPIIHRWDHSKFGCMKIGELSVGGMQGYDSPQCRYYGRPLGEVVILERTTDTLSVHIRATIPVWLGLTKQVYNLQVNRKYLLQRLDPINEMVECLRPAPIKLQDKLLKRMDPENRKLVSERLGSQPTNNCENNMPRP